MRSPRINSCARLVVFRGFTGVADVDPVAEGMEEPGAIWTGFFEGLSSSFVVETGEFAGSLVKSGLVGGHGEGGCVWVW